MTGFVVQWIGRRFPVPKMQVRFLPRSQFTIKIPRYFNGWEFFVSA